MRHLAWLFSLLLSTQALAFGFNGHKALCQAAYDLTSAKTQKALDNVVAKQGHYGSFAESCTWADDIKKDHQWDWSKPLHYINVPRGVSKVTADDCAKHGCALSAIRHYQALLKEQPQDWQALFFLSHFVGDLHQPLHVSYEDDLGGNRAMVTFFGEQKNLHGIWDYGLLDHLGASNWKAFGDMLASKAKPQFAKGTPLIWANESYAITKQIYVDYQHHKVLAQQYVDRFGPKLELQMEKGAERLAKMLDNVYNQSQTE
ncbi:S1/P1 nuclease [Gallaecimonas mangrovi]|uniref:S1/P1 nuclease n=1 Tax=Gallaecimonas mangrovi TaxID=2291597 RepID=UPI000E204C96|nr:S1/P1 nuclease [Gallaecimonas mangrovi]